MKSWRDKLLNEFKPKVARLTLVADPDGLLTEEGMLSEIRARGFDLIPFDDSVAFRFAYEAQYRSLWDHGIKTDLVVVLRSPDHQLDRLPFDLLKTGRKLSLALHLLFPKLSYPVIAGLDKCYLDQIDTAYQQYDGTLLTEKETKDFVLMFCFGIVRNLMTKQVDIFKVLFSLHSKRKLLPGFLADFLLEHLKDTITVEPWLTRELFLNRDVFFRFLQSEWCLFIDSFCERKASMVVPFEHDDIRVYVDNFFLDGELTPIEVIEKNRLPSWTAPGVIHDPVADSLRRFHSLSDKFSEQIPSDAVSHREWQHAALCWAELVVLRWELDEKLTAAQQTEWSALQLKVEQVFARWMHKKYAALHNLAYHHEPVMVHQIVRFLAVEKKRRQLKKIALLVLDGLALDQWILLRKSLENFDKQWDFAEGTAFAWVPSITSISRQSIFAGEPPLYFPDSLETTSKEKAHWLRFWEDNGISRQGVDLVKSLSTVTDSKLELALANPRLCVLGIVWNKVDDIMHGMELQTAGMHDQVRLWAKQGHLHQLLIYLHQNEFTIFITADHGNVTAKGIGKPKDGVLAETHGERARVYPHQQFRDDVLQKFPESIAWPNHGLPAGRFVLLPGELNAFTDSGNEIVCHGGIALEEIMVPFIEVKRVER